jgi:glycogen operon protein
MIAHGDEVGRTQHGNNNAYCQDSELAWVDWELDEDREGLLDFTARLVQLRKDHPVFRRRRFFAGDAAHGGKSELGDIEWFAPQGNEMDELDWRNGYARSLMVFLNGDAIPEPDHLGRTIVDDHFLLLFNAHSEPVDFILPPKDYGALWQVRLDTTSASAPEPEDWKAGSEHAVPGRSVVVLSSARDTDKA